MKAKIILAVLLVIIGITHVRSGNQKLNPDTEKKYWRFIKERLFDGETSIASKFQNNIGIHLKAECKDDSIIVNDLLKELQVLIPNKKIKYCNSLTRNDIENIDGELINIAINKSPINSNRHVRRSKNINGNQIYYSGFKGLYQSDIFMQQIHIQLNDSITFSERKRYIEYAILRSMCTIKGNSQEANTIFPNAIFNDFDYDPYQTEFSEVDKFLLQKLYSEDFQEQFKSYLIENYSRRYYRAFLFKEQYQSIKMLLAVLIILFVLALSYKPVIFRNYKRKFISYLVIAILIGFTAIGIHMVLQHVALCGIYDLYINLIISGGLLSLSVVTASILFVMEYLFIKPSMSFIKRVLINIVFVFIIGSIPSIVLQLAVPDFGVARMINFITFSFVFAIGRGFLLYIKEVGDFKIREKDFELIKLKELNTNAEMQSLNAKINPHFLYNSLNSIAGLARSNPDKTEQMAIALSDLYKYATNRSAEQTSSILKEVEMVKSYLEIEKIRFGARLTYSIQLDPETEEVLIPRNILQPLVENAIKHGISKIEDEGEIKLAIQKSIKGIIIKVYDNGLVFPDGLVSGFGLQSIQDILKLYYKGKAELSWQNVPEKMVLVEINSK